MSPEAIATNSAMFVGYEVASLPGALLSTAGMIVPSFLFMLLVSLFFRKAHKSKMMQSVFYGLRPVVIALIMYAAVKIALSNGMFISISYQSVSSFCMFALALFALIRLQMNPVYVIVLSGLVGVCLYV